jgi:hypothetical protein
MNPAPPAIKNTAGVHRHGLPFRRRALQQRMADQQMPQHGAQPFGMRRDAIGRERRNHDAFFGYLPRESAVKRPIPHDAEDVSARFRRRFERANDIDRYVFLAASAAHREDQHAVARADARALQPGGEAGVPAFVIRPGGELGNVVGGRVGFKTAQLAKVVDRVAGVAGRPADAQDEQAPAEFANPRQTQGHALDGGDVHLFQDCDRLGDEPAAKPVGVGRPLPEDGAGRACCRELPVSR